jgi:hypothetical protein
LERRLAAVEGREASLIAELRSAEAMLAERDAALAAAAGLREQLGELGRERGQLQHHKQVRRVVLNIQTSQDSATVVVDTGLQSWF